MVINVQATIGNRTSGSAKRELKCWKRMLSAGFVRLYWCVSACVRQVMCTGESFRINQFSVISPATYKSEVCLRVL